MGAPFDSGTWNGVENAYYVGAGGGTGTEMVWLVVSIGLCLLALWMGHSHEMDAYKRSESTK